MRTDDDEVWISFLERVYPEDAVTFLPGQTSPYVRRKRRPLPCRAGRHRPIELAWDMRSRVIRKLLTRALLGALLVVLLVLAAFAVYAYVMQRAICLPVALRGVLTERAGDLVVVALQTRTEPVRVDWPEGYVVRRDGDTLVLVGPSGNIEAREGQTIVLGGGSGDPWQACGGVTVLEPTHSAHGQISERALYRYPPTTDHSGSLTLSVDTGYHRRSR
jgi:hypothetical protein